MSTKRLFKVGLLPRRYRPSSSEPYAQTLSANDVQMCLRTAFGGTLGFIICKLMNWNYGTFFVVYPMLLLALVPVLNGHVIRQFLAGMMLISFSTLFVQGVLGDRPIPMTMTALVMFAILFRCMSQGPYFLFGALGITGLSIQLHFASYPYPSTHVSDMVMSNIAATFVTILIAMLMHTFFPDAEPRTPRKPPPKPASNLRHEIILTTTVATLSFIVFQTLDLRGSLSAQMASILILFPLNWHGAGKAAWNRAVGTLIGCNVGLLIQFVLLTHSNMLLFVSFGLWFSIMLFARHHAHEGGGSGAGFGAMTTMATLFGQYLTPTQDLVYNALYRFTSVSASVVLTLLVIYLMHRLLNRFEATRLCID